MKEFLFIIVFLLISTIHSFTAVVTGTINSESDGSKLPYVNVYIDELIGTVTELNGKFVMNDLQPGTFTIEISAIGYEKKSISLTILSLSDRIDLGSIFLQVRTNSIDEVLILHTSDGYRSRFNGTNNYVSIRDLKNIQPTGTEEVLKAIPGLNIEGDMGISNRLNAGIRGSYPRRSDKIVVLEDGSPVAPAPYLAPSAYYNPPTERLDGIEVYKGSDILTYGANTMYGVINYITKRPPLQPRMSVELKGGTDQFNTQYLTYGGTWKNTGAEIQIMHKSFDGFIDHSRSRVFNSTAKVFSELDERQTIYLKLNYHHEKSQATYSGLTPLTYWLDPKQNPFDADDLITSRLALDLVYNIDIGRNFTISSKIFAHQFKRDWWRQNTTLIKAALIRDYLGEEIFSDRYDYLDEIVFEEFDYVRVGLIKNNRENTRARNRQFKVAGIQEKLKHRWSGSCIENKFELGWQYHREIFHNEEIQGDSSRFSRSGNLTVDENYSLDATSAYVKNTLSAGRFTIVPTIRIEYINMTQTDLLKISSDPDNDGSKDFARSKNSFVSLIPGIGLNISAIESERHQVSLFAGLYKGYTPPTSSFGFLSVNEEEVSKPAKDEPINIKAENSVNFEAGIRGKVQNDLLNGQIVYFNNHIRNFYAAGRKEAFRTLGSVNVQGAEIGMHVNLLHSIPLSPHSLRLNVAITLMRSRITGGRLMDSDLLKAKHTDKTSMELIEKINRERNGYLVYLQGDSLLEQDVDETDLQNIEHIEMIFGEGRIEKNQAPYTPHYLLNLGISYGYKGFHFNASFHAVGQQYTEYLNFINETAEGAIGRLNAYQTTDLTLLYEFESSKSSFLDGLSVFISGKNLTNKIYKASRLHRVSSGIIPGGFLQFTGGLSFTLK